jgi:hypothetical protein
LPLFQQLGHCGQRSLFAIKRHEDVAPVETRLETGLAGKDIGNQGTELEFVIMVIAVSCVKLLSAHNSTQHTSRKHKV